ncbi:MAG: hypothetical protein JSV15_02295 [Candidatus Bathyarchaeota archaeon]|nr:MAG: hypothetical protein JSV15_02295 [Candidatus Bathyarchaeota archaeon]
MIKKVVLENMTTILLITLIAMTLLWFVLFYQSWQEYDRYAELFYDWAFLKNIEHEKSGGDVFYVAKSYWEWNGGKIIVAIGFVLLCSWVLIAREKWLDFRASREPNITEKN